MRQIDQFKKFDKLTPLSLLMIHQTHHLKKCNNQTPLLLPPPPVELCLGRHTCLRLQRQSHLPKFSFIQKLWRPFGRVEARKEGSTERKEKSEVCTDIPVKKRMEEKKHSTRQTDRQIILFNIWKNQISVGGEWPQGLRVILPLETQSNCTEETQVQLFKRQLKVYKFHIDLHISTKTVQTYP